MNTSIYLVIFVCLTIQNVMKTKSVYVVYAIIMRMENGVQVIYLRRMKNMETNSNNKGKRCGVSLGCVIAVVRSFLKWHSIGRAILHGILGWFYVIYYMICYL